MSRAKAYVRPTDGWWRKNPFFVRYMIREWSSAFLGIYALILLAGMYFLSRGEAAYSAWLQALMSPLSVVFHCVALLFACYHTWSWFEVMPKTIPSIFVNGSKLSPRLITASGIAASAAVSAIVFLLAMGVRP
jgi:fumarate reductase subunit C